MMFVVLLTQSALPGVDAHSDLSLRVLNHKHGISNNLCTSDLSSKQNINV
jgi:hypothetical protein